ncbi:MAG: hypothetical protein LV480_13930 [Methylacidiphilales bacterium]|nr:hypothetical protein [Candidatus Methylacidiphilales bacterium]
MNWRIFSLWLVVIMSFVTGPLVYGFPAYHDPSQIDQAKTEARQRDLPLAWLGISPGELDGSFNGPSGEMAKSVLPILSSSSVVVLFDGTQTGLVPQQVYAQFMIMDDGVIPGGHHWRSPKVVFTNPEVTKVLGRVSYTQMQDGPEAALGSALQIIRNDPMALALPKPSPVTGPSVEADSASSKGAGDSDEVVNAFAVINYIYQNSFYFVIGAAAVLGLIFFWAWRFARKTHFDRQHHPGSTLPSQSKTPGNHGS